MSSDQTPATSASESPNLPADQGPPEGKKRNPVERFIVWGLIIALVAVCGREAVARFGYTNSLNRLQAALEADDQGQTLMIDQVATHLSGSPTQEADEANRIVSYHWSGLLKDYGSIHIQYSDENEVLGLMTADAPPPPSLVAGPDDAEAAAAATGESMPGSGGGDGDGSGGGRGRRFDPMQADADGDGKLSLDEAPGGMKQRFAEIDANSDGFVDEEELAARRAARRSRGSENSGDGAEAAGDDEAASGDSDSSPAADSAEDAAEETAEE